MFWRHELQRQRKTNLFAKLICENVNVSTNLVAKIMETIGKTNRFHNRNHGNYGNHGKDWFYQ